MVPELRPRIRRPWPITLRLAVAAALIGLGYLALDAVALGHQGPRIAFYGRLIDRDGRPIADHIVHVDVFQRNSGWARRGFGHPVSVLPLTATTAADGRFAIHGVRGVELRVNFLEKDRYFLAEDPPGPFIYDAEYRRATSQPGPTYQPDADRPAVFVLYQLP
jgi:hypothetical protein